jgi:hypothetical protein
MGTVSINLRLRPIRFAFLIRPDDQKHALEAFRINTCLWGGRYNPIIPFFKQLPNWWDKKGHKFESAKQILNGYLDFFEPDFIVEAEKGLSAGLGFDSERVLKFSDILVIEGARDREGYGLSVNNIYKDLYKKEFQFARRHKHNIVSINAENKSFDSFVACIWGGFPSQLKLRYFEQNFKYVFEPKEIKLTEKLLPKLYKTGYTSALKIGQSTLDVNYNDHSDPALFVLNGHESRDLIDFWNLRIVRRNILAIPLQWIQDLSPFCKEFILKNHRPLPGNPNGVMIQPVVMFSRSISEQDSEEIFKKYLRVDKKDANCIQQWYPPLWRPSPEFMVRTTRPTVSADEQRIDVSIDLVKPEIKFDTLWPEFVEKYGNRHRFANVVKIGGWGDDDQLATSFPCNYRNPSFPKFRLGREHLLPTAEGLVFFPEYKNISERWELVSGTKALNAWFNDNKISAILSEAGRSTQQIIQTLGGFWGVGKIAKAGTIKLLDEMSRKPLTRSVHYAEFRQKIKDALGESIWKYKEFETLVERNAVELGLELKCSKCGNWGWHSIKHLDYSLVCDLCLQKFDFPITSPGSSQYCKWAYRVIGPFALPNYANGGYASALGIRFFSDVIGRMDKVGVTWSAGQELSLSNGKKIEADFILWYQRKQMFGTDYPTEVVFGETKSFGKDAFKDDDVGKMKALCEAFPGAVLVFATMKEAGDLSKEEIGRIRKLAEWGREYDKEKDQTRAPVIMLTGTELFGDSPLEHVWKEKGGKHAQLIAPAYMSVRLDNLHILADLTQQLYLGMPSYHAWMEDKWKRRAARRKKNSARTGKKHV